MKALGEERRRRLLAVVNEKGSLSASDAERTLDVSRMTVHRDMDMLAAKGLVRKVHGGVVAAPKRLPTDGQGRPFAARMDENRSAKQAVARRLAKLVAKARTLVLDGSSTVFYLSEALPEDDLSRDRFVVTGSLPLFSALSGRRDGLRVALHGGEPHPRTGSLVGPLALASLGDMRFDVAIVSCLGVLAETGSVYVVNTEEVEIKRAYLAHARSRVLAIDSSKLGQSGPYKLAPVSEFNHVVTEKGVFTAADLAKAAR